MTKTYKVGYVVSMISYVGCVIYGLYEIGFHSRYIGVVLGVVGLILYAVTFSRYEAAVRKQAAGQPAGEP